MQMKGWECSEIFVWLLYLPFSLETPVCSSPVQMLLDDLLGLPKWLQLLQMEYIFPPQCFGPFLSHRAWRKGQSF